MIVPGSGLVKEQAEAEGLDKIFIKAGFEWREPGCSMCLAMNPDKLAPGERCASTSNRNFEGRQGYKGRTHLVSPAMAAAAAIAGHFVDVREWQLSSKFVMANKSPPIRRAFFMRARAPRRSACAARSPCRSGADPLPARTRNRAHSRVPDRPHRATDRASRRVAAG